jgi:drug/metabolite transporter (DMT)-like permease
LLLLWGAAWGGSFWAITAFAGRERPWWTTALVLAPMYIGMRLQRANFTWDMEVLGAMFGYPMFSYLLLRSKRAHKRGGVSWKGRKYSSDAGSTQSATDTSPASEHALLTTDNR